MYFKVLLSKAGTSLENIPNAIDHIKLYPSFSSVSMGKIYTLHNLCAYKDLKSRATLVAYAENLLMRSGVVRLLIKMPKGHTEDMFTAQGYQKDPFVYYTKELLTADIPPIPFHQHLLSIHDGVSPSIVSLFNEYRMFYHQPKDMKQCANYLAERLMNKESIIVEAIYKNVTAGFVQLYPDFSTDRHAYTLNDLFVNPAYRNLGIATNLIKYIQQELYQKGISKIFLKTALDNPARKLYERLEYKEDSQHIYYYKNLATLLDKSHPTIPNVEPLDLSHNPQITLYEVPSSP